MKSAETEKPDVVPTEIVDHGDGPKLKGTRVTVYTILEYLIGAWSKERIAQLLDLSDAQVQAAIDYIDQNELEVLRTYVKILERIKRGHPPELQAKIDAGHARFQKLVAEVRAVEARAKAEIHTLIREHRERPLEEAAHVGARGGQ